MRRAGYIVTVVSAMMSCLLTGCTGDKNINEVALTEYKSYDSMTSLLEYGQYITDRYVVGNHYWIDDEGILWGTGANNYYQLGLENPEDIGNLEPVYTEPVEIAEDVIHVDVSHNGYFVVYLTKDHELYGLGSNTRGVLLLTDANVDKDYYDYNYAISAEPVLLMKHVAYASAGAESLAVLTDDKDVYWWGCIHDYSATSDEIELLQSSTPQLMVRNAKYIMNGNIHSVAIDESGGLWTWGGNVWGECGVLPTDDCIEIPQQICDDVVMAWPDIMTNWQNEIPANDLPNESPYSEFNYPGTLFVLKTDGTFYACGVDLGGDVRTVSISSIDAASL